MESINETKSHYGGKPQKKHVWIWVLGWILIFPIPLTVLILRNNTLTNKLRCGIISVAWLVYLVLALFNQNSGGNRIPENRSYYNENSSIIISETESETYETETTTTTMPETIISEVISEEQTDEVSEIPEISTQSADEIKQAIENGDYSLVTPEFKETMDAYEAFYDEYIAFMKKYTESGNLMDMMSDYMSMLSKLEEWNRKIDAIDENKLSEADDLYYLLVTLRIEQKMLGAIY